MPDLTRFARLVLLEEDLFDLLDDRRGLLFPSKTKNCIWLYIYSTYKINYTENFSNELDFKFWQKLPLGFSNGSKLSSRAHDLLSSVERKVCGKDKGKGRHFLVCPP